MTALKITRDDQGRDDPQRCSVVAGTISPQAKQEATPMALAPAEPILDSGQCWTEPQTSFAAVEHTSNGSAATREVSAPMVRSSLADPFLALTADAHSAAAAVDHASNGVGSGQAWLAQEELAASLELAGFLALAAGVLDDTERNRIANENRLRQLTRKKSDSDSESDSDGEERGWGLDLSHPSVAQLAGLVQMMNCKSKAVLDLGIPKPAKVRGVPCCLEHTAEANLTKMLKAHPLGAWVKAPAQKGIGEKQGARLLGVIGDPCHFSDGSPRSVSQLWSYCGHGDPTRKRRKGMTQDDLFALGSPVAKSRLWLISTACLKAQGPYADVYYARKDKTEGREHASTCVRCGPSGSPALAGSPWSLGHRHADALRVTGKEILRDLWLEARRIHGGAA